MLIATSVPTIATMRPDGNLIRRLRRQANHETLTGFAARIGVDPGQLSRIETGKRTSASYGWLLRVADGLGVPVEVIATWDDEAA